MPERYYDLTPAAESAPHGVPLIAALKGFADAGSVVDLVTADIADHLDSEVIAMFRADDLLDYRSRRPTLFFDEDHAEDLEYLTLTLSLVKDSAHEPFYFLSGFEPDFRWQAVIANIIELVDRFEMSSVTWVHSIPMPVPHTRPIGSSVSGNDEQIIKEFSIWKPKTSLPASLLHALEYELSRTDHEVSGFVMLTPHYLAETEYPPAAVAALERITLATGLVLPTDELRDEGHETQEKIAKEVSENSELATMVQQLEERHDEYLKSFRAEESEMTETDLPSADELGAEFESFLAQHHPDSDV